VYDLKGAYLFGGLNMACMTHYCRYCGHSEFNNNPNQIKCPWCGNDMRAIFDEKAPDNEPE